MSKTRPWWVRMADAPGVICVLPHDHRFWLCTLPDGITADSAFLSFRRGNCYWKISAPSRISPSASSAGIQSVAWQIASRMGSVIATRTEKKVLMPTSGRLRMWAKHQPRDRPAGGGRGRQPAAGFDRLRPRQFPGLDASLTQPGRRHGVHIGRRRYAVGSEATGPSKPTWLRSTARSAIASPPSASITARSTATRPGS